VSLFEYVVPAASSLFVIMDPLTVVPVFLVATPGASPQQRIRIARAEGHRVAG
jgi:small neutral amino acid transporter SnatA (MarC family)